VKPFHFKLQTKLDVAVREEQMAKEELYICLRHRDAIMAELLNLDNRIKGLDQSIKEAMEQSWPLERLLLLKDYLPVLKKKQMETQEKLRQAEEAAENARRILVEKARDTKVLNKLREKEWQMYLEELNKEEQKNIDEIAISSHYRRNLEGNT